jgi:hypothetical protein
MLIAENCESCEKNPQGKFNIQSWFHRNSILTNFIAAVNVLKNTLYFFEFIQNFL